jgi:hypothetical protein
VKTVGLFQEKSGRIFQGTPWLKKGCFAYGDDEDDPRKLLSSRLDSRVLSFCINLNTHITKTSWRTDEILKYGNVGFHRF